MTETLIDLEKIEDEQLGAALIKSERYARLVLSFLPEWRPYFHDRAAELPELERSLKEGLDDWSHAAVHRLLRFYEILLKAEAAVKKRLTRYDLLLRKEFFQTAEETEWKKQVQAEFPIVPERFRFPENKMNLVDPVPMGLCFGLRLVPDDRIALCGKDVIDGGGFCGDSALAFCDYSPKRVYAFEPSPNSFELLRKVIRLNDAEKKIIPVPTALSDQTGVFPFYTNAAEDDGAGLRFQEGKTTIDVPCTTIDDFVKENDLCPGLIKLDIEGAEQAAIFGAVETLRRFKPILLISVYHRAADFFEIKPFLEHLGLNYQFLFRPTSFQWMNMDLSLIASMKTEEKKSQNRGGARTAQFVGIATKKIIPFKRQPDALRRRYEKSLSNLRL